MTAYKVTQSDDSYKIEISGHSGYAQEGNDIVCAGISMAVAMTANIIEKLGYGCNIMSLDHKKGYFLIITDKKIPEVIKVMDSLVDCLETLEKQYPKNIKSEK